MAASFQKQQQISITQPSQNYLTFVAANTHLVPNDPRLLKLVKKPRGIKTQGSSRLW